MLGNRSVKRIIRALFQGQHYVAFANMFRIYRNVPDAIMRYAFNCGTYPATVGIKTPVGVVNAQLYSHHDMLTVNEIFCRKDYHSGQELSVVVDIGSNIGISALYFMTRNTHARCYLFEPDPRNVSRLHRQLEAFKSRYVLTECAIADRDGEVTFGVETSGRYGGIDVSTGESIVVKCRHINSILAEIIEKEGIVDLVKIDTEGVEIATVKAIDGVLLSRIRRIFIEAAPAEDLLPRIFTQRQYGSVSQLTNNTMPSMNRIPREFPSPINSQSA